MNFGWASRQASKQANMRGFVFVTTYVRTSPVRNGRVLYKQATSVGASLCAGDRGPEQTDEPGDPGQSILAR